MSLTGFFHRHWGNTVKAWWTFQARRSDCREIERSDWHLSTRDPSVFYRRCFRYFHTRLPEFVREHRMYFHNEPADRRGFGEDVFHTLWFLLVREFKPDNFLEIGVYRGQVISLVAALTKSPGHPCEVHGISPFSAAGDSVTQYRPDLDYYQDTLSNFAHFGLPAPQLVRACSNEQAALERLGSREWDLIYIDGNHDYEVVRDDWKNCANQIKRGGVIVLDDAGLTSNFRAPAFATRGHPGPSRVAAEIDQSRFAEVLQVGHNRVFQRL